MTQEELKSLLHYDPKTGEFTWLVRKKGRKFNGRVGSLSKRDRYLEIGIGGKLYKAHRLAWLYIYGKFPECEIDHINMVRDDNRIENLRQADHSENKCNIGIRLDNTSGHKGVYWSAKDERWRAEIRFRGYKQRLGSFKCKTSAALAYSKAALKLHGEFSRGGVLSHSKN